MTELTDKISPSLEQHACTVGVVASLMNKSRLYRRFPLASLNAWIDPAIFHGQIKVFYNQRGAGVGYITWAHCSDEVVESFATKHDFLPHLSEWNEGGDPFVVDFLVLPGHLKLVIDYINEFMFAGYDTLRAIKRDGTGRVVRLRSFHRRRWFEQPLQGPVHLDADRPLSKAA